MSRSFILLCALAATIVMSVAAVDSLAQVAARSNSEEQGVTLARLSPPIYPPLAKQARIIGDVDLELSVRQDGSLESVAVVTGHPLLTQAALDSVRHSQFECRSCGEAVTSERIVYTFQLDSTEYCSQTPVTSNTDQGKKSYPQVIQSINHVTVMDEPIGTCDSEIFSVKKVRSAKCLYLWRCGVSTLITHQDSLP
jgi:TonB family protein